MIDAAFRAAIASLLTKRRNPQQIVNDARKSIIGESTTSGIITD
ncbi:hypothetical protein [Microbacterium capsulatum]|nr:hypothetical protein [Microbacterium sp. ASV81]